MMMFSMISAVGVTVAIMLISLIFTISVALPRFISATRADTEVTDGYPAIADVVEIAQTGVTLNQVPQMRMVLRIHGTDARREVRIRQYVDLGNMPRVGERVRVVVDKADPTRVTYRCVAVQGS